MNQNSRQQKVYTLARYTEELIANKVLRVITFH